MNATDFNKTQNSVVFDDTRSLTKQEIDELNSAYHNDHSGNYIQKALKFRDKLTFREINAILMNLINRKRFTYSTRDILKYIFDCIWCKRLDKVRSHPKFKKHFIYQKGEEKL